LPNQSLRLAEDFFDPFSLPIPLRRLPDPAPMRPGKANLTGHPVLQNSPDRRALQVSPPVASGPKIKGIQVLAEFLRDRLTKVAHLDRAADGRKRLQGFSQASLTGEMNQTSPGDIR
jgi:hypothetical protein